MTVHKPSEATLEVYDARIRHVGRWIREHLHERLDPESLARLAHFSPYHFQRIFRALTGETLVGYIRRLRLDEAARRLRETDDQIVRIAFDAGYTTHESFTRAFKARFGVTPREFREKGGPDFWREQPTKVAFARNGAIAPSEQSAERQAMMEVVIEDLPEQQVLTFRKQIKRKMERAILVPKLFLWAIRRRIDLGRPQVVMIDHRDPSRWQEEGRDLEFGLVVGPEVSEDERVSIQTIGGGPHTIARCDGEITARERAFDWLYGSWLPANNLEPADKPTFIQIPTEPIDEQIGERLDAAVERDDDEAIIKAASELVGRYRICIPVRDARTAA